MMIVQAPQPASSTSPWWPPVVVAACALLFTVASFWWLNARRGSLRSFEPHSFAAVYTPPLARIVLPVIFYNTGAAPIVVQDLRLVFPDEQPSVIPLPWNTTRNQISPGKDDWRFPAVFAVAGRTAERMFIEFKVPLPDVRLEARDYAARIQVELGHKTGWRRHKTGWRPLMSFTFRAGHISDPAGYGVYSNSPGDVTDEDRNKAEAALRSVVSSIEHAQPSNGEP